MRAWIEQEQNAFDIPQACTSEQNESKMRAYGHRYNKRRWIQI